MCKQERLVAVLLMMVALMPGCTFYGGRKDTGWQATGAEAWERQFWADLKAKRYMDLERHMAVTWVFLTPSGPMDRAATLQHMRQVDISDYQLGDFKVVPNGNDMIVTYTATVRGTVNGRAIPDRPQRMMTVWQKAARGWHAIAHADVVETAASPQS